MTSRRRSIRNLRPPPIIRTPSPPSPVKEEGSATRVSDGGWDRRSPSPTPFLQVPNASVVDNTQPRALSANEPFYDPNRLSPVAASFPGNPLIHQKKMSGLGIEENNLPAATDDSPAFSNPFNFQTQVISTSPVKPTVGQRRGHRYKHSSISAQHQIFQEPPPRPPLVLPASLPVPTFREAWRSISREQRARLYWCLCHAIIALLVFLNAHGSLAMTALSHLIFFDFGSALLSVAVDVVGNFEVWKRSSIRHPFGLERAEVLAGFAMSVFLIFGGFDLVSHDVKHVLESAGGHEPHHPDPLATGIQGGHNHPGHDHAERVGTGEIDWASIAAILATLISAYGLRNQKRISKVMRVSYLASLPSILSNPFHFLTLTTSFLMLALPLLNIQIPTWFDRGLCLMIAVAMFGLGFRLAVAQGLMLLMSFGGRPNHSSAAATLDSKGKNINSSGSQTGVSDVLRAIEAEPGVERVEDAQFWQVHYGLCMANLKVCVSRGCDDNALTKLRSRIASLIQNRLGEGYGRGGSLRWEVSLQMSCDN